MFYCGTSILQDVEEIMKFYLVTIRRPNHEYDTEFTGTDEEDVRAKAEKYFGDRFEKYRIIAIKVDTKKKAKWAK